MRKSNEQSIREVISDLFEHNHMKGKLAEVDVIANWEKIVGPLIAKQTEKIWFYRGKLFLQISSPALRQELNYSRSRLVELVNQYAGMEMIEDVSIK